MLVAGISGVFVVMFFCWVLYDKEIGAFLLPISPPVTLSFMIHGNRQYVWVALLIYAILLGMGWYIFRNNKRGLRYFFFGLLVVHISCYMYTTRALEEMGATISEQLLRSK